MKILIDENLPRYLKRVLAGHDVSMVQEMGWSGIKNGELLKLAEPIFDLFLTADKNIRYQQNLKGRKLSIIVFPSNKLSVVKTLETELKIKIVQLTSGAYIEL
jgi:predicted nuclease of predicted toxin-antitoxin system